MMSADIILGGVMMAGALLEAVRFDANPHEVLWDGLEFTRHFGITAHPVRQADEYLAALQELNPRYQGERELVRFELEKDQTKWSDETIQVTMQSAERMRMLEKETPLIGEFAVVVALGAARQAPLDRTRYAVHAIQAGKATTGQLIAAGSARKLIDSEPANVANYAPDAIDEYDLCAAAAKTVMREQQTLPIATHFTPKEKAGTPDVLSDIFTKLARLEQLPKGARVGAVTTQIYQLSTHLDLKRVASRFGIELTHAAGNPSDPKIIEARTPATYLSEVLRTLQAAVNAIQE